MGRATQAIDYFNADPKDVGSKEYRDTNYTNITITDAAKKARKKYRRNFLK